MTKRTLFLSTGAEEEKLTVYFEVYVVLVLLSFTCTGKCTLHFWAVGQFSNLLINGYF
jgi:hypothetical protein